MPSPLEICGNCVNFDLYRMKDSARPDEPRELIGRITLVQGKEVKLGFCRAERGLLLGARPETNNCGFALSAFLPKEVVLFPNLQLTEDLKNVPVPGL